MQRLFALSFATLSLLLAACSAADEGTPAGGAEPAPVPSGTTPAEEPSSPPPPSRELPAGWEDALKETIHEIDGRTGLGVDLKVDTAKLEADALSLLRTGGKDAKDGFRLGVQAVKDRYPVGHLQIYPSDISECGTVDYPFASSSFVDACTQPYGDHAVVSAAGSSNALGLVPGDEITAVDGKSGQAMLDAVLARPMCGTAIPSASNKRMTAATSIFANVKVGSQITIKRVTGAIEIKTVATLTAKSRSCRDPLGRSATYVAKGTLRPDGAGVLHIPSFSPRNFDANDPEGSIARFKDAIKIEFDKVKTAPFLVIDVRGNPGGATLVGLAIAAGMPGAKATKIAKCQARVAHSTKFDSDFDYDLEPSDEFAYTGKVAVLADGLSFSAADYFVRTMRLGTNAVLVGRPNAGAYGGSTNELKIEKGPGLLVYPDPWRCTDAAGKFLEGLTVVPDLATDLEPAQLAKGIDSDVEGALGLLKKPE